MSLFILVVRRVRLAKDASIYFILLGQATAPLPGPPVRRFVWIRRRCPFLTDPAQNGKTASTIYVLLRFSRHLLGEEKWHIGAIITYLLHMEKLKLRERRKNLPKATQWASDNESIQFRSPAVRPGPWNCHRSSQGVISSSFLARSEEPGLPSPQTRAGSGPDRFRHRDPLL